MIGETLPGTCSSVNRSASGNSSQKTPRHRSPPRMPVSQSCTRATRSPRANAVRFTVSSLADLLEDGLDGAGGSLPGEEVGAGEAEGGVGLCEGVVGEDTADRGGDRGAVLGVDEDAGVADDLGERGAARDHD